MGADDLVTVQGFLILEALRRDSRGNVTHARLAGTRVHRPYLQGDQVTVALTLRAPRQVFGPVRITADVTVDSDSLPGTLVLVPEAR